LIVDKECYSRIRTFRIIAEHIGQEKTMLFRNLVMAALPVTLFTLAGPAGAVPVLYTESVIGSGSLDGINYNDADVVITGKGDTANITIPHAGAFKNAPLTGTVTVTGIGTDMFSVPLEIEVQGHSVVGFALSTNGSIILTTTTSAIGSYALDSTFGPVFSSSPTGGTPNAGTLWATTGGGLYLTADGTRTFQAFAPEPASIVLLGGALSGLIAVRRRTAT
jgi:hypothetical protein